MTQRDLTALVLRGTSLLAFLYASRALPDGVEAATWGMRRYHVYTVNVFDQVMTSGGLGAFTALGSYCFLCCFALILWRLADVLAYFLTGRGERAERVAVIGCAPEDALTLLLVVGGLYVTVSGLSLLLECISTGWIEANSSSGLTYFSLSFFFVRLLNALLPLGVGTYLLLQGHALARRYTIAQRDGVSKQRLLP